MTINRSSVPLCSKCSSNVDVIEGDGPVVCRACVLLLGHIVREPEWGTDRVLAALDELHSDVVTLVRDDNVLAWQWTDKWPGVSVNR